jgi:hypothetical protein
MPVAHLIVLKMRALVICLPLVRNLTYTRARTATANIIYIPIPTEREYHRYRRSRSEPQILNQVPTTKDNAPLDLRPTNIETLPPPLSSFVALKPNTTVSTFSLVNNVCYFSAFDIPFLIPPPTFV